jgi:hypothetical protein
MASQRTSIGRVLLALLTGFAAVFVLGLLINAIFYFTYARLARSAYAQLGEVLVIVCVALSAIGSGIAGGSVCARWWLGPLQGALFGTFIIWGFSQNPYSNWTRAIILSALYFFGPVVGYLLMTLRRRRRELKKVRAEFTFEQTRSSILKDEPVGDRFPS